MSPRHKNENIQRKKDGESKNIFRNPKNMIIRQNLPENHRKNLIDWITFYRRNIHLFVKHYFGIKLYPYQIIWMYLMSVSDTFVAICSRAIGKSWLIGVYACARAVLYPNSEIVIVSSTKAQAGLIVSDKITNLRNDYPNLAREISNIVRNINIWEVSFHNGSTIKVVASRDSARGRRSNLTIYEEFRLIDKEILDAVIRPFAYVRQTPYLKNQEFMHLGEEPKEIFISSAYHKGLWWFDETKKTIKAMIMGDNSAFIAVDYLAAVKHHIKTIRQIKNERSKVDEITALEEYDNIPWGESSTAYFKLRMFNKVRTIKKAFYPQRVETYNSKKNPYAIVKADGEIRIVSADIAQRAGKLNDLSISSCIRFLPTHKGYFRELVYMESFSGVDSITQTLRLKQLFYDFESDVIVLDVANSGITILDQLGTITKDAERGLEYPAMTVLPPPTVEQSVYDELSKRTLGLNAIPVIFPITASAKLNSIMAVELRDKLQKKMFGFLIDDTTAEDYLIKSSYTKEFLEDSESRAFFLAPHVQTSLAINEMINLSRLDSSLGLIKLVEPSGARKDRYTSISYGNHYGCYLDADLMRDESYEDEFTTLMGVTQWV